MSGRGDGWKLVEADAGYVDVFDVVGCVIVLFREGDGEVLDLVCDAESHQELDEVSEVFDVEVVAFVGSVILSLQFTADAQQVCRKVPPKTIRIYF